MGDRYVKSDENKKILYIDAINLFGWAMSESLPYDETEMWHGHPDIYMIKLEEILNTPDDSDIGYFVEVDLSYPDDIKEKTKNFPYWPENKAIPKDKYNDHMKTIKAKNYTKAKKIICHWTDEKNYLVHYRKLKFYVRHGMIVDKIHELISFKQSRWLEKYISFNTQKRNKAKNEFKKHFYEKLNIAFYGKTMENLRNRITLEFTKNMNIRKLWNNNLKGPSMEFIIHMKLVIVILSNKMK